MRLFASPGGSCFAKRPSKGSPVHIMVVYIHEAHPATHTRTVFSSLNFHTSSATHRHENASQGKHAPPPYCGSLQTYTPTGKLTWKCECAWVSGESTCERSHHVTKQVLFRNASTRRIAGTHVSSISTRNVRNGSNSEPDLRQNPYVTRLTRTASHRRYSRATNHTLRCPPTGEPNYVALA